MSYLYRYECKGIQEWITAGGKLREMVAASAMIDGLGDRFRDFCAGRESHCVVAAGHGLAEFSSPAVLAAVAADWPSQVDEYLPGIELIHAWVKNDDDEAGALADLFAAMGPARAIGQVQLPEAGPLAERTGRTGEAAVARNSQKPDKGRLLDRASVAKLRRSSASGARDTLVGKFDLGDATLPESEEDFGASSLAVVHADGNGIGNWLATHRLTAAQYGKFAGKLRAATEAAAQKATQTLRALHAERMKSSSRYAHRALNLPIRPVVLGGDDVTVILGPELAIPWTNAYLVAFEHETKARLAEETGNNGFTSCAGVVWVKTHWPFEHALHVAEALCKGAKDHDRSRSSLLMHRLVGSTARDWDEIRESELAGRWDGQHMICQLGGQPYTPAGLADLLSLVGELQRRRLPRGSVRELFDALQRDVTRLGPEQIAAGPWPLDEASKHWRRVLEVQIGFGNHLTQDVSEALRKFEVPDSTDFRELDGRKRPFAPIFDAATWAHFQPQATLLPAASEVRT